MLFQMKPYIRVQAEIWPEMDQDWLKGGNPSISINNNIEQTIRIEAYDPNIIDYISSKQIIQYNWYDYSKGTD